MGFFDALLSPVMAGIQKHNQMDLNEQANRFDIQKMSFQNKLNRQNSLDSPLLNKLGLQSAGLNVNSQFGFSPVAGSSVSSSSGGSASMPMTGVDFVNFVSSISQAKLNDSLSKKAEADADLARSQVNVNKTIENLNISQFDLNNIMTQLKQLEQLWLPKQWKAEIAKTWSESAEADFRALDFETQQAVKSKQIEEFIARIENIEADTSLTPVRREELKARAYQARMAGLYSKEQAEKYGEYIKSVIRNNDSSSDINDKEVEKLTNEILVLGKDLDWYEVNKVLEIVREGYSVAAAYNQVKSGRYLGSKTNVSTGQKSLLKGKLKAD